MKTTIGILILALCTMSLSGQAKRRVVTTARATSYDISDNLDLEAVASIFGESKDLEDFEYRLNDPDSRISNLDLNEDGYIDYLRVIENSSNRNSLVIIQAVLDRDVYQDVATLEIERMSGNNHRIQIVGDPYIYGSNYIIEPVFVRTPLIFSFFWGSRYNPWQSPYYWNYYPRWYHSYRPYSPFKYHRHIDVHVNRYNSYNYTYNRNIHFSGDNYSRMHRDDYANQHPNRAFNNRHEGVTNRRELIDRRSDNQGYRERDSKIERSVNRQNQDSRQNTPGNNERLRERNPRYQEKSGQVQPREFKRNSDNSKVQYNQEREQRRNQNVEQRQAPERRQESTQERPSRRIESRNENNSPQEKSGSVRTRSTREVKQKSNPNENSESGQERKRARSENRRNE
jgi:hypothetical protein